ncbi:MAG TPA: hypothetical protein VN223_06790 [Candidatus Elarobacter sp.]|nr:hypothetical protein [Candidatus Elarobacter sp.]
MAVPLPMSLGAGGLLGRVEPGVVPVGLLLPGWHGLATVAEVPLGRDAEAVVVVEVLPAPLFAVVEVLPVVEGVLLAVVEVPVVLLLEGVHGATVVEVPVWVWVLP